MPGITLVGLGPGDPNQLTREAWQVLASADVIWLRTSHHPVVVGLPGGISLESFDDLYDRSNSFDELYSIIVEKILELGRTDAGVVYAVPGHPFVAETTGPELARRARAESLPLRVVEGLSFLEPTFTALGVDPYPRITLCDALSLGRGHVPGFAPDGPVLIAQIYSRLVAAEVKSVLSEVYPDTHAVRMVHGAGTTDQEVEALALYEIDRSEKIGGLTSLYLPSLGEGTSFEAFQEVVAHLRAPEGCPWDREQTHASLRRHLLEEAYEAVSAMDSGDFEAMREELGDLLLQIVLNAQIASEEGEFTSNGVIKSVHDKIVRRHPHVFGDVKLDGVRAVLTNWERLKEDERNGRPGEGGLLDGVPEAMPALIQAQQFQERAARVGFDWPEIRGVLEKIVEEIDEVQHAEDEHQLAAELGDLFFALVNLARWKGIDAESALRATNTKFKSRFAFIERRVRQQSRRLSDLSLAELEALWQEAKRSER